MGSERNEDEQKTVWNTLINEYKVIKHATCFKNSFPIDKEIVCVLKITIFFTKKLQLLWAKSKSLFVALSMDNLITSLINC